MKRPYILLLIMVFSLSWTVTVLAKVDIATQKVCKVCGMDREQWNFSRVLLEYNDGSSEGFCSIHCAAMAMTNHPGGLPKTIKVADYNTKQLIDAEKAVWVIGGKKAGVMTQQAKWAFGDKSAAESFIEANEGELASFDQVMKATYSGMYEDMKMAGERHAGSAAEGEQHAHMGHDMSHMGHDMSHMGPGAQMLYNPAFGDEIYHVHPAGMWMAKYQFMHQYMDGLRHGTTNEDLNSVGYMRNTPFNYMMIPTSMSMDMQMLMVMYGITDKLTVMAMGSYQANTMDMLMDMGPMMKIATEAPMRTNGFGDTELRAIYGINDYFVGSLGLGIPTGSINQTIAMMGYQFRAPYDMQLGSGTVALKPALTYSQLSCDALWNWGAQVMFNWNIGENRYDYTLGNTFKATAWLQRALGPFTSSLRFAFTDTGQISGQDSEIQKMLYHADPTNPKLWAPTPDADPTNYGGQRLDGLLGLSYTYGPFSVGVEGGIPLYQYLNGLQLKTNWLLNTAFQVMF